MMSRKYYIFCNFHYLFLTAISLVRITHGDPVTNAGEAAEYLIMYEYLEEPHAGSNTDISTFVNAIRKFQEFAGIPQTGELDDVTLEFMNRPRCGVPENQVTVRSKRYATNSKWNVKHLTWNINQYTEDVSRSQLDEAISNALKYWSDASGLTFERVDHNNPDIIVLFPPPYIDHGDTIIFDGKGNILAHAFYPGSGALSGDAHFDDGEQWTVKSAHGTNILSVATHEFGHSIGLAHSTVANSIMWPWRKPYEDNLQLHSDDILGVQELYGPPSNAPETEPPVVNRPTEPIVVPRVTTAVPNDPKPTFDAIPSNCQVKFDAITVAPDGGTYAFKGNYYWQMVNGKVFMPKVIANTWPNIPSKVDAVVTVKNRYIWKDRAFKTFFFKGRQVYRYTFYNQYILDEGFPRDISWEFPGFPNDLTGFDAVIEGIANGQTYFFRGNKFYIYDYTQRISGPFSIKSFKGIPSSIVAGFQWTDNYIYFFTSSGWYYQFSPWNFNVNHGFPRLTVQDWFGCGLGVHALQLNDSSPGNLDNSGIRGSMNLVTILVSFSLFSLSNNLS